MNTAAFETIQHHITEKLLISIERKGIDENVLRGFPLFVNSEILIMTNIYDFHDEGILVLKTTEISDAYSKESDEFYEKMCRQEGLDQIINPFPSCEAMYDILTAVDTDTQYITIQCEKKELRIIFFYRENRLSHIDIRRNEKFRCVRRVGGRRAHNPL